MLIDTHSHIYLDDFDKDRNEMIQRAENEGVNLILMPAIDSQTHHAVIETERQFPNNCLAMMGFHPCSVKPGYGEELKVVKEYFEKRKFVAVGETGLDFYWDLSYKQEQIQSFHEQIELAIAYQVPVVIHSRNSTDECIQMISEHQKGKLKGVFHCFSGNRMQAQQIIDLGFYLGIGGVVTFKNSGLDKVMNETELKHIILETDSPYLAPAPFRGKRNECCYLKYVVDKLVEIKSIPRQEIETATTTNAKELFGI